MPLKIDIPQPELLKPKITIFGVGGAGGNAINNMIRANLEGVDFVAANTDAQSLQNSLAQNKIQLGLKITRGLGAGSFPDRGRAAAEENVEEIERYLEGSNMVFIAAGMGGGTGTGAAPVIAKLAREREILTVGVVTKPFFFEGKYRMETAEAGIEELKKHVDTLIVIPNQNLFRIANENTTFESAFKMADDVLHAGVRGVTDLITMPGLVNLDFADIRTIMTKMGKAMMGTGEASGENRAIIACEAAVSNPLLDDISIRGAKGVLVNMTGGPDMTLFEADMAVNAIKKEVDPNANIIFGSAFDENMKGRIRISVVATGIDIDEIKKETAKAQEIHEPSRFRVDFSSTENSKKSSIDIQNKNQTFFDPGFPAKVEKGIDEEAEDEIPSDKKSKIEYPLTFDDNSQNQEDEENDFVFGESKQEEPVQKEEKIVKKEIKKPAKSAVKSKKPKEKKESGGFGLFSFMNSSKNKNEDEEENFEDEFEDDFTPEKITSKAESLSKEADKKRSEFFGAINSTVFDEEEKSKDDKDLEADVLNIPAFFRRKK